MHPCMPTIVTPWCRVLQLPCERASTVHRGLGTPLVQPVVTPRFVPTCTPELLRALGRLAQEERCHVQSHISESLDNQAFVAQLHPEVPGAASIKP